MLHHILFSFVPKRLVAARLSRGRQMILIHGKGMTLFVNDGILSVRIMFKAADRMLIRRFIITLNILSILIKSESAPILQVTFENLMRISSLRKFNFGTEKFMMREEKKE